MDPGLNDTALWDYTALPHNPVVPVAAAACDPAPGEKFNRIFFATKDRLYHFVWKLTQHETDTKDIIQNCYLRVWEKIESVNDTEDVLPLLFTCARNMVIDHLRKKARRRLLLDQLEHAPAENNTPCADQLVLYKERLQQLQTSINRLPAKRKEIFTLVKQEGFSHKKVAEHLGISPATVEKQVGLSLKFLRKSMNTGQ